jgi:hypothetical protein
VVSWQKRDALTLSGAEAAALSDALIRQGAFRSI